MRQAHGLIEYRTLQVLNLIQDTLLAHDSILDPILHGEHKFLVK